MYGYLGRYLTLSWSFKFARKDETIRFRLCTDPQCNNSIIMMSGDEDSYTTSIPQEYSSRWKPKNDSMYSFIFGPLNVNDTKSYYQIINFIGTNPASDYEIPKTINITVYSKLNHSFRRIITVLTLRAGCF